MTLEKARYMPRLSEMLKKGHTDMGQMAAAFGLSPRTISRWKKEIENGWLSTAVKSAKTKRAYRVKQFELAMKKAIDAFDRSQQSEVEVKTVTSTERCQDCNGSGMDGEQWCVVCEGDGELKVETTTTRVRGQAGDSSHLNAFIKAVAGAAKLENLYQPGGKASPLLVGMSFRLNGNPWGEASDEALLKAHRTIDGLRGGVRVIEADVVEEEDKSC